MTSENKTLPGLPPTLASRTEPKKGRRLVFDEQLGRFVEGRAKPAQLDPELRALPSEYVTKEVEDGSKIHELDPPNIRESLQEDFAKAEAAASEQSEEDKLRELQESNAFREAYREFAIPGPEASRDDCWPTQARVDWLRFTTARQKILTARDNARLGAPAGSQVKWLRNLQHLWFPTLDVRNCEVREGGEPPHLTRPGRLKGLTLVVDVFTWPRRVVDLLAMRGIELPDAQQLFDDIAHAERVSAYYEEPEGDEE